MSEAAYEANAWTPEQLCRCDVQQALDPDFVADQTRSIDESNNSNNASLQSLSNQKKSDTEKKDAASNSWMSLTLLDPAASISSLLATVSAESATEHLTAGLRSKIANDEGESGSLARLSRGLAAIGLSADTSYSTLAYKRTILVQRLYDAYLLEHKNFEKLSLRSRKLPQAKLHPLLVLGIRSGVHIALSLLQSTASNNHTLCWSLLHFLQDQLSSIQTLSFSLNSPSLPHPEITLNILNAIQSTLCKIVQNQVGLTNESSRGLNGAGAIVNSITTSASTTVVQASVPDSIRYGALDLMLSLAVARGCLPDLLTIVKLLFIRAEKQGSGEDQTVAMYSSLSKLQRLAREVILDLPSQSRLHQTLTINELKFHMVAPIYGFGNPPPPHTQPGQFMLPQMKQRQPILVTNGQYLFVYCQSGLYKIGTGNTPLAGSASKGGAVAKKTVAGTIYAQVSKFRAGDEASMVCVGDRLYWRSQGMPLNSLVVIDCETLTEIGTLTMNGTGSVASHDNSAAFNATMKDGTDTISETTTNNAPPTVQRTGSIAGAGAAAAAASGSPGAAGLSTSMFADASGHGFGMLTSDGTIVYSITKRPEAVAASQAMPSVPNGSDFAAANSSTNNTTQEHKEREEKNNRDDSSSSSDSDDDDSSPRPPVAVPSPVTAAIIKPNEHIPFILHAFNPVDSFKMIHSTQFYRARLDEKRKFVLSFPPERIVPTKSSSSNNDGGEDDSTEAEDTSSDSDEELVVVRPSNSSAYNPPPERSDRAARRRAVVSDSYQQYEPASPTAKPASGGGSKKSSRLPLLRLCAAQQLSFTDTSFTAEVWLRLPPIAQRSNKFYVVLQRGTHRGTFMMISSRMLLAGTRSQHGLSLLSPSLSHIDVTQWNHYAISYDSTKKTWTALVNGIVVHTIDHVLPGGEPMANRIFQHVASSPQATEQEIANVMNAGSSNSTTGSSSSRGEAFGFARAPDSLFAPSTSYSTFAPGSFGGPPRPATSSSAPTSSEPPAALAQAQGPVAMPMGDWSLGEPAQGAKRFIGEMRELRLWSTARTEEDIKSRMKVGSFTDNEAKIEEGLMAYYRLNDAVGYSLRDASRFNAPAYVRHTKWMEESDANKANGTSSESSGSAENLMIMLSKFDDEETLTESLNEAKRTNESAEGESTSSSSSSSLSPRIPYLFHSTALEQAVLYTNGESIAIIYRPKIMNLAFPSFNELDTSVLASMHIVQFFSIATGELQSELEYRLPVGKNEVRASASASSASSAAPSSTSGSLFASSSSSRGDWRPAGSSGTFDNYPRIQTFSGRMPSSSTAPPKPAAAQAKVLPMLLSASMSADGSQLWILTNSETDNFKSFHIRAPMTVSSWRASIVRASGTDAESQGLTSRYLQQKYVLKNIKSNTEQVALHVAIIQILVSLNHQLDELGAPTASKCPASLIIPIAVDLSQQTFACLLDLTEQLVQDYYRSEEEIRALYGSYTEVRLFGLLVAVRLLKTNISHLVTWNVDPQSAFSSGGSDSTVQSRFSTLLNQLIFNQPTSKSSKNISSQLIEDVTSVLSIGITVFLDRKGRIGTLLSLVDAALDATSGATSSVVSSVSSPSSSSSTQQQSEEGHSLRLLLMNRYLAKLTQPDQMITLMPAFIESTTTAVNKDNQDKNGVTSTHNVTTHPLLVRVYQLVHRSAQSQLNAYFARFGKSASSLSATGEKSTGGVVATDSLAALSFLKKLTVCMLSQATKLSDSNSNAPTLAYQHAIEYVRLITNGCVELLSSTLAKIEQLKDDVRFDELAARETVIQILSEGPMVLVQPLLSAFLLLRMNAPISSSLLPTFIHLLQLLNDLLLDVPAVIKSEQEFVKGEQIQVSVNKKRMVETAHPVSGMVEMLCTVPGATSMQLTMNQQTHQSLRNSGCQLHLYRKANQEGKLSIPFGGSGFSSTTTARVPGDTVYIVFHSGSSEGYGFSIQAVGTVLEPRVQQPLLLDITKQVALVAGRLSLVLVRGVYTPTVVPATKQQATSPRLDASSSSSTVTAAPAAAPTPVAPVATPLTAAAQQTAATLATNLVEKWVSSEFLSEGVEYDSLKESDEESALEWLPQIDGLDSSSTLIEESPLTLKRAGSYRLIDVSLLELVRQLDKKLHASDVSLPVFPIAKEAVELVNDAIRAVMAVTCKMNMLTTEAQQYIQDSTSQPTENLIRLWKTSYKMRNMILQKYQEQRNTLKIKEEEEEVQKLAIYSKICKQIVKQCEFLLTVVPVPMRLSHNAVVTSKGDATSPDVAPPTLVRQGSSTAKDPATATPASATDGASLSSKIVQAWNQSKSQVSLREANAEERFNLIWKHLLNFISTDIDLPQLSDALKKKRDAARMRAAGYRVICRLLNVCRFACVKRELVSCITPSLGTTPDSAYDGARGSVLMNCTPSNLALERQTRAAFKNLYQTLLHILESAQTAGTALLCSILHTFSLQYEEADFDLVVELGIFPLLNTLLLTFSKPLSTANDSVAPLQFDVSKLMLGPLGPNGKPVVIQTTGPARPLPSGGTFIPGVPVAMEMIGGKFVPLGSDSTGPSAKHLAGVRATYHAAFTLLDSFMSTLLTSSWQQNNVSAQRSHMSSIHDIVEKQLESIASTLITQSEKETSQPTTFLPSSSVQPTFFPGQVHALQQRQQLQMQSAFDANGSLFGRPSGFGGRFEDDDFMSQYAQQQSAWNHQAHHHPSQQTQVGGGGGNGNNKSGVSTDDDVSTDVLNIVDKLVFLPQGRARISQTVNGSNIMLTSLIHILKLGKPRARIIVLRILRRLCTSHESPSFDVLNSCFQATMKNDEEKSSTSVDYFLRHIGACLSAPSIATLALQHHQANQLQTVESFLKQLRLYQLYSNDGVIVWSEELMLLRCFAQSGTQSMIKAIVSDVTKYVGLLPTVVKKLSDIQTKRLDALTEDAQLLIDGQMLSDSSLLEDTFRCLGALSTIGGWIDSLHRVGSRVRILNEGGNGTVVSHRPGGTIDVLRDEEGSIVSLTFEQCVSLSDVPFNALTDFKGLQPLDVIQSCAQVLEATKHYSTMCSASTKELPLTPVDSLILSLRTRTVAVMHAFLSVPSIVMQMILSSGSNVILNNLFSVALNSNSTNDTSSITNYRMNQLEMEFVRRTALPAVIMGQIEPIHPFGSSVQIETHNLAVTSNTPGSQADPIVTMQLQSTCFNTAYNVSIAMPAPTRIVYLPLNALEVNPSQIKDQLVAIDTHESLTPLKTRLLTLVRGGARAIVLCMHSADAQLEGIANAAQLAAKGAANKGDDDRPPPTAATTRETALGTSGMTASEYLALRSQFGGGALASPARPSSGAAAKGALVPATQQSIDDLSTEDKALLQTIPIVAIAHVNAATLRSILQVQDRHHPDKLHHAAILKSLIARGYLKAHAYKALRKTGWNTEKALAWLESNKDWLANQTNLQDDEEDDGMEDEEEQPISKVQASANERESDEKDDAEEEEETTVRPSNTNDDNDVTPRAAASTRSLSPTRLSSLASAASSSNTTSAAPVAQRPSGFGFGATSTARPTPEDRPVRASMLQSVSSSLRPVGGVNSFASPMTAERPSVRFHDGTSQGEPPQSLFATARQEQHQSILPPASSGSGGFGFGALSSTPPFSFPTASGASGASPSDPGGLSFSSAPAARPQGTFGFVNAAPSDASSRPSVLSMLNSPPTTNSQQQQQQAPSNFAGFSRPPPTSMFTNVPTSDVGAQAVAADRFFAFGGQTSGAQHQQQPLQESKQLEQASTGTIASSSSAPAASLSPEDKAKAAEEALEKQAREKLEAHFKSPEQLAAEKAEKEEAEMKQKEQEKMKPPQSGDNDEAKPNQDADESKSQNTPSFGPSSHHGNSVTTATLSTLSSPARPAATGGHAWLNQGHGPHGLHDPRDIAINMSSVGPHRPPPGMLGLGGPSSSGMLSSSGGVLGTYTTTTGRYSFGPSGPATGATGFAALAAPPPAFRPPAGGGLMMSNSSTPSSLFNGPTPGSELISGSGCSIATTQDGFRFKNEVMSTSSTIKFSSNRSTSCLLHDLTACQFRQLIHYSRRILCSVLAHWPKQLSLKQFAPPSILSSILHVSLALDSSINLASESSPESCLSGYDFRTVLHRAIRQDSLRTQENDKGYLSQVVYNDIVDVLSSPADTKSKGTLVVTTQSLKDGPSAASTQVAVTSRTGPTTTRSNVIYEWQGVITTSAVSERTLSKMELPDLTGIRALVLQCDAAPLATATPSRQSTVHCVFYDEDRIERRHVILKSKNEIIQKAKIVLGGNIAYYSFYTEDDTPLPITDGKPAALHVKLAYVRRQLFGLTLFGNLFSTLYQMDVILTVLTQAQQYHRITMLLLQTLSYLTDRSIAQLCCSMSSKLFGLWKKHRHSLSLAEWNEITSEIHNLETSYSALRTHSMMQQWNITQPSQHMQILLELVLAARTAISTIGDERAAKIIAQLPPPKSRQTAAFSAFPSLSLSLTDPTHIQGIPRQHLLDAYSKSREGDSTVSLISLNKRLPAAGNVMKVLNAAANTASNPYAFSTSASNSSGQRIDLAEIFVAPIALKGLKWYYEVTIKEALPGLVLSIGWITRTYRFQDRTSLQQESTGTSWTMSAPGMYCHKYKSYGELVTPPSAACTYANGTVIGCYVDLDAKTMSWSFNGRIDKMNAFTAFTVPPEGLFPAISVGQGEISVNLGSQPFAFEPNRHMAASKIAAAGTSTGPTSAATSTSTLALPASVDLTSGDVYLPVESPSIPASSYLDQLDTSYNLLQSLAERHNTTATTSAAATASSTATSPILPQSYIDASIANELSLLQREQSLAFEYADSDTIGTTLNSFGQWSPAQLLQDNAQACQFMKSKNLCLTFKLAEHLNGGKSEENADGTVTESAISFLLKSIMIRVSNNDNGGYGSFGSSLGGSSSTAGAFGLIFLSDTPPLDYDMLDWCNDFKLPQYNRFVARKKTAADKAASEAAAAAGGTGSATSSGATSPLSHQQPQPPVITYAAHEPVGFINNPGCSQTISYTCDPANIRPARYVTLKLSNTNSSAWSQTIEYIKFGGMLTSHPLAKVHGTAGMQAKLEELKQQLVEGAREVIGTNSSSANSPKSSDESLSSSSTGWTLLQDENLTALLQTLSTRAGVSPSDYDVIGSFSPSPVDLSRYPALQGISLQAMKSRICILKYCNRVVTPLLGYISTNETRKPFTPNGDEKEEKQGDESNTALVPISASAIRPSASNVVTAPTTTAGEFDTSISSTVRQLSGLYFLGTKKSVFESFLSAQRGTFGFGTPVYSAPRISVNRLRASRMRDDGTSASLQGSVFHQIFSALRSQPPTQYRLLMPDQQVWNVTFAGEGSIDVGGPFRESLTNLCADLMSAATNLFILSPNGTNNVGLNRSTYLPSPSASSSVQLQQFEFIGYLFGIALRTRLPLALDLPSSLWKTLLDQRVDISDLEAIDKLAVQALTEIKNLKMSEFQSAGLSDQKMTTQLSDGSEIELRANGRTQQVTYENRHEFVRLSIEARLTENRKQIDAIRKGMNAVLGSTSILSLFTWQDLELLVCGSPTIDIEALRRHTVYNKLSSSDNIVIWLFRALHSFSDQEKQLFLRFVWGRNRLPATDSDWSMSFTINRLGSNDNDESLPVSHTCFNSIDLPQYTSYDVLRKKLLYAIQNCQAIDVDFNPARNDMAWGD